MPDAGTSVPEISGSLPAASGVLSVPSVSGGADVDVDVISADVDPSSPSAPIDLPGDYRIYAKRQDVCLYVFAPVGDTAVAAVRRRVNFHLHEQIDFQYGLFLDYVSYASTSKEIKCINRVTWCKVTSSSTIYLEDNRFNYLYGTAVYGCIIIAK